MMCYDYGLWKKDKWKTHQKFLFKKSLDPTSKD